MATSLVLFKAVLDCNTRLVRELCNRERLDEFLGYKDPHSRWTPLLLAAAQAGERVSLLPRAGAGLPQHRQSINKLCTPTLCSTGQGTASPARHWQTGGKYCPYCWMLLSKGAGAPSTILQLAPASSARCSTWQLASGCHATISSCSSWAGAWWR
jgi:hypothetical protein